MFFKEQKERISNVSLLAGFVNTVVVFAYNLQILQLVLMERIFFTVVSRA